jgi:hypothetical protein
MKTKTTSKTVHCSLWHDSLSGLSDFVQKAEPASATQCTVQPRSDMHSDVTVRDCSCGLYCSRVNYSRPAATSLGLVGLNRATREAFQTDRLLTTNAVVNLENIMTSTRESRRLRSLKCLIKLVNASVTGSSNNSTSHCNNPSITYLTENLFPGTSLREASEMTQRVRDHAHSRS